MHLRLSSFFENFKSIQVHLLNCHSAQGHSCPQLQNLFPDYPGFGLSFVIENDHGGTLRYRPIGD